MECEKYREDRPWDLQGDFICPQCGASYKSSKNQFLLHDGQRGMVRWCPCGYQGFGRENSLSGYARGTSEHRTYSWPAGLQPDSLMALTGNNFCW